MDVGTLILGLILGALVGGGVGAALAAMVLRGRHNAAIEAVRREAEELRSQSYAAREQVAVAAERESAAHREAERMAEQLTRCEGDFRAAKEALDQENVARARTQTELDATRRQLDEQRKLLEEAERRLGDTFKALSSEALRSNNQSFLELARESMQKVLGEVKGDLTRRQEAIDVTVKPVGEALKSFDGRLREMENRWSQSTGQLMEQVTALNQGQLTLRQETGNLVSALRRPEARGRWGEATLRRVVELSGMSEHCDYSEQVSVTVDDGSNRRQRPDMVINLPAGRQIIIDSKAPLDAYLSAVSARTDEERQEFLRQHARQIRKQMELLASKNYQSQFPQAPDFVVMFIPGESFFAAAVDIDTTLIEDAGGKRIAIATPATLIALLRTVAYGWREESLAESARQVSDLGKELYKRLGTFCNHLSEVGSRLGSATRSYNNAVNSLESRLMPSARKFEELKVVEPGPDYQRLKPVELMPREVAGGEASSAGEMALEENN